MTLLVDRAPGPSDPADPADAATPRGARAGAPSLGRSFAWIVSTVGLVSVVCAALLLTVLNVAAGPTGFWSADETVTHEQVELLDTGTWTITSPEPELDPTGQFYALQGVSLGADGAIAPYAKHPLFPLLVSTGDDLAGRTGRFLIPGAASLLAAIAIASGAERRRRGSAVPTFWFMLAGSPLLFHGAVLWAHSLGVLGAAIAFLVVQSILAHREQSAPPGDTATPAAEPRLVKGALLGAAGLVAVVGSVLVRSEAAVFFVVAGSVVAMTGLVRRHLALFVAGAGACVVTVAAFVLEASWRTAILGDAPGTSLGVPEAGLFDVEVRSTLLALWVTGADSGLGVLRLLGIVFLIIGALRLRNGDESPVMRALPLLGAGCYVAAVFAGATSGVAIAAPLVVLGLLFGHKLDDFDRIVLTTAGLAFFAVLLTSHANGGGGDWGGRYHAMSLAPLGMIAGPRVVAAWNDHRRPAIVGGAIASIALAVGMFTNVIDKRAITTDAAVELEAQLAEIGSPDDLVLITDARIARLMGEWEFDQRRLQVPIESMFAITDQLPGEEVLVLDWLTPYEAPVEWTVVAETDEVTRYRLPG